jgi:hypothetical protein
MTPVTPDPARPTHRLSFWALPAYLAIAIVIVIYLLARYADDWRTAPIGGTDGQAYYAFAASAWVDGDLDFDNEFFEHNYNRHGFQTLDFLPRSAVAMSSTRPGYGRIFNRFGIGYAVLHTPFFLVAHGLTTLGNLMGAWRFPADGYSVLYQLAVVVGMLFYAACAFYSTTRILRRFFSPEIASGVAFVAFLSYPGIMGTFWYWCNPHAQTLLVFNGMILTAFRVEDRRDGAGTWVALGALTGLAALLRTELAFLAIYPLTLYLCRLASDREGRASLTRRAALAPLAALIVFFPQIVAWRTMAGEWFRVALNNPSEGFHWSRPMLGSVLFSTRHGLFYWTPLFFVGALGLVGFLRSHRGLAVRAALVPLGVAWYVYASWAIWWMGYSFGARQFILFTGLFALGVAWATDRVVRRGRAWTIATILAGGAFALWNIFMFYLFLYAYIPRSEGFSPWLPFRKALEIIGF